MSFLPRDISCLLMLKQTLLNLIAYSLLSPFFPPPLAKDGLAVGWQEEMGLSGKLPNAHIDTQRLLRTDDITALSHTG